MSILTISYDGDDPLGTGPDRTIVVSALIGRELTMQEAENGIWLSSDILIILPHRSSILFEAGGETHQIDPGVGLVVGGHTRGRILNVDFGEETLLPVLELGAVIDESLRMKDLLDLPHLLDATTAQELSRLHRLLVEHEHSTPLANTAEAVMHLIAGQVVNALLSMSSPTLSTHARDGNEPHPIDRLKQFLNKNLSRKTTTGDMADHMGMSRQYFCQWVKPLLGKPPASYLREMRMERSLDRLINSADSIESIAEHIGFADRYHFGKEFKKRFGTTPAKVRKDNRPNLSNALEQANNLYKARVFGKAASVCEDALKAKETSQPEQSRVRLLYGRCLAALDRTDDAMNACSLLAGTPLGWDAGLLRCQLAFDSDRIDTALDEMNQLWQREDADHNELIQLWIRQVTIFGLKRRSSVLRKCLDFRKENFIEDETSEHTALVALRGIGSDLEILEQCPNAKASCFLALRRAGLYDRALAEYGDSVNQIPIARLHFEAGQYDRILDLRPMDPEFSVRAMVELGQARDAIKAFPDHCARAYIALGEYQQLLDANPKLEVERVYALTALDRQNELSEIVLRGSFFWHWAQCYRDPEPILQGSFPDTYDMLPMARCLTALKWLMQDRREDAGSLTMKMESIESPDLWPWADRCETLVLTSVLKALLSENTDLNGDLSLICRRFRYLYRQTLYYDAAYLMGEIDTESYQRQPMKHKLYERWVFIRSIAHDLAGRRDDACAGYRELIEKTSIFELSNLVRHRFCEWRLHELT